MKSIVILFTIINLIKFIINKGLPKSSCQITLIDDDWVGKDNKTYNSDIKIAKLVWDLRKDVKEIILKNNHSSYPCKFKLYTCKKKNYKRCKKWSGIIGGKQTKKLRSSYIKKMVSIKGNSLIQAPKPKPKSVAIAVKPNNRKVPFVKKILDTAEKVGAEIKKTFNAVSKLHSTMKDKLIAAAKAKRLSAELKCNKGDKTFVCDEDIIGGAYDIYRHVRTHLKIKNDPVVHGAEFRNKVGEPSTIVMHEVLLRNFMVKNQSAFYRICVVPSSQKKFIVFTDIQCPFNRCPTSKYQITSVCDPKDTVIQHKFKNQPHAILLKAFNRRKRLMIKKK